MLVLTRLLGESIVIDGGITIEIVDIKGGPNSPRVKLGITAPRDITILRKEVQDCRKTNDDRADH